jgi:hypothetical protein
MTVNNANQEYNNMTSLAIATVNVQLFFFNTKICLFVLTGFIVKMEVTFILLKKTHLQEEEK